MTDMRVDYDPEADAAYVSVTTADDTPVARSVDVAPGLIVDLDAAGQVVGLELLGLSARGLPVGLVQVSVATGEKSAAHRADEDRLAAALDRRARAV